MRDQKGAQLVGDVQRGTLPGVPATTNTLFDHVAWLCT